MDISLKYQQAMNGGILFLLLMLDNIVNEEPDFKFKAFLEVLIEVHKISANTIAKFAKIKEQDVLDFINDTYVNSGT
ncbi:MAG: hypothetical protein P4L59_00210 [Desulfosporosinus sp.]|nr:hypothetical protein [Desulfosporosinus sp.]